MRCVPFWSVAGAYSFQGGSVLYVSIIEVSMTMPSTFTSSRAIVLLLSVALIEIAKPLSTVPPAFGDVISTVGGEPGDRPNRSLMIAYEFCVCRWPPLQRQ